MRLPLCLVCCWLPSFFAAHGHSADDYTVKFIVQIAPGHVGDFSVTVREKKAPLAAVRFKAMVHSGFFDGCTFFRVLPGFVVQFGLSGNVTRQHEWDVQGLLRDETRVDQPDWNARGTMAFVNSGANSRGTQIFVNYDDNHALDAKGTLAPVPFARVVSGMATLDAVYSGYRERPRQANIRARGDAYLKAEFSRLSYIVSAQQVAFVEEPFALSKNATGLLITLLMVLCAGGCCGALRHLQRKAAARQGTYASPELPGEGEGEDGEDEEDEDGEGPEGLVPDTPTPTPQRA
jgi:peptidyl-prolyl cis-trans isomerase A (cyclophilin A)